MEMINHVGSISVIGRYIPTATAKTGTLNSDPIFSCLRSIKIRAMAINPPMKTKFQGRFPVKTPSDTDFINVACGADKVGDPIVYAV